MYNSFYKSLIKYSPIVRVTDASHQKILLKSVSRLSARQHVSPIIFTHTNYIALNYIVACFFSGLCCILNARSTLCPIKKPETNYARSASLW